MAGEQRVLNVLRAVAVNIGEPDDDGEPTMTSVQIVSRSDVEFPIAAARVVTAEGPVIVLADTAESVLVPVQDARKVAAYLLAHAEDGPAAQGKVRVRSAVGITRDGYWYAMGHGSQKGNAADWHMRDEVLDYLSIETDEPVAIHWIEADIPLPANQAIQAYPLPDADADADAGA